MLLCSHSYASPIITQKLIISEFQSFSLKKRKHHALHVNITKSKKNKKKSKTKQNKKKKKKKRKEKEKKEKERKRSPGSRLILKMKLHIARKNGSQHTKYCVS